MWSCVLATFNPDPFSSSLLGVLAQRLVRKLCEYCKVQVEGVARGCQHCGYTGYHGRTAIFEMLVVDDLVRKAAVGIGRVTREPKKDDGKKSDTKKLDTRSAATTSGGKNGFNSPPKIMICRISVLEKLECST